MRNALAPVLICSLLAACGSGRGGGGGNGDGGFAGGDLGPPVGTVRGQVVAPQGSLPISGAVVYLSPTQPDAIPDGTYCDKCVPIAEGTPIATSAPDGTFTVPVYATGPQYLIVQKGQFRRVRPFTVVDGDQEAPIGLTTLPGKMDKANGDDIPRMAVLVGQWDRVEVSLAKLGLGTVVTGAFGMPTVDPATASFDLYQGALPGQQVMFDPQKLLTDWATISKYHIVFIPCSGSDGTTCNDPTSGNAAVQQNLQKFVAAGGKLYVTDYSYDFVRQPFPGYVDWVDETAAIGSACQSGSYDAAATVDDTGMRAWLDAQGLQTFSLQANWTTIDRVNTVATTDVNGNPAMVTPKVWVRGQTPSGVKPSTISFERGCGRVLFSTYHTEADQGAQSGLLAQERALMYVLLETATCIVPPKVN